MGLIEHPTNSASDKVIGAAIEVHRHLGPGSPGNRAITRVYVASWSSEPLPIGASSSCHSSTRGYVSQTVI